MRKIADGLFIAFFALLCLNAAFRLSIRPVSILMASHGGEMSFYPLVALAGLTAYGVKRGLVAIPRWVWWGLSLGILALGASIFVNPIDMSHIDYPHGRVRFLVWQCKTVVLSFGWMMVVVAAVHAWYRRDSFHLFGLMANGILLSLVPVTIVGVLELMAKTGVCPQLDEPMYRVAKFLVGDSIPLYRYWGRLRSLFPEPSYLACWGSFALPALLAVFANRRKTVDAIGVFVVMIMMMLSMSRTAMLVLLAVLVPWLVLLAWWKSWNRFAILVGLTAAALGMSAGLYQTGRIGSVNDDMDPRVRYARSKEVRKHSATHVKADATAVIPPQGEQQVFDSVTAGAMADRAAHVMTDFNIFKATYGLGCGHSVAGIVFEDYYRFVPGQHKAIDKHFANQRKLGRVEYVVCPQSTWSRLLAEHGVQGFLFYGIVICALCWKLFVITCRRRSKEAFAILTGFLGFLAASISTYLMWSFQLAFWVGFALVFLANQMRDPSK